MVIIPWSLYFCGRCEEVCPTKAIRLSQDFELSVTNKQDLFQETTFATVTCQECGKPFISYKELNYTIDLFKQTLDKPELVKQNWRSCILVRFVNVSTV